MFEFLSDLRNHWRLEHRFVALGGLEGHSADGPTGGRVRVRGPLGLSRLARTEVLGAEPPEPDRAGRMWGRAEIGSGTVGRVEWEISAVSAGSRVRLSACAEQASPLDRLVLLAGGGWWLRRIFVAALARLDDAVAAR